MCSSAAYVLTHSPPHQTKQHQILKRAAGLPLLSLAFALVFLKETKGKKDPTTTTTAEATATTLDLPSSSSSSSGGGWALSLPPLPVRLLVLNGFLLMYGYCHDNITTLSNY